MEAIPTNRLPINKGKVTIGKASDDTIAITPRAINIKPPNR